MAANDVFATAAIITKPLRSYDGGLNKNVTSEYNVAVS